MIVLGFVCCCKDSKPSNNSTPPDNDGVLFLGEVNYSPTDTVYPILITDSIQKTHIVTMLRNKFVPQEDDFHFFNLEEGKICLIYLWTFYKPICKQQLRLLDDSFVKNNWDNNETKNYTIKVLFPNLKQKNISDELVTDIKGLVDTKMKAELLTKVYDSHKKVFDGIFETLQTGLSKLGETSNARTKAISDLIAKIGAGDDAAE